MEDGEYKCQTQKWQKVPAKHDRKRNTGTRKKGRDTGVPNHAFSERVVPVVTVKDFL